MTRPYGLSVFSGQNNHDAASVIKDHQATKAQNVFTDEIKGISSQPRGRKISTLPEGINGSGAWTYVKHDGSQFAIMANKNGVNSKVFTSPDGVNWTAAKDQDGTDLLFDDNFVPEGITYKDLFWITDGLKPVYVFDGTLWRPAGAPSLLPDVAGNPNGAYKYLQTWTIDGEEIIGQESFSITVVNKKIKVDNLELGPDSIQDRQLYRTKAGGTIFYKVFNLGTTSTTSFLDNVADGALVTALNTPNQGIPRAMLPVVHFSRLWLIKTTGDPDTGFFSFPDFPHIFPADNFFALPLQQETIWGASSGENLLITTEERLYPIQGDGIFRQFVMGKIIHGVGSLWHRSIQPYHARNTAGVNYETDSEAYRQVRALMAKDGYYLYNGIDVKKISYDVEPLFQKIIQPNLNLNSKLFTTQGDWASGANADGNLDETTNPGDIKIKPTPSSQDPNQGIHPNYTGVSIQLLQNGGRMQQFIDGAAIQWPNGFNEFKWDRSPTGNSASIHITAGIIPEFMDTIKYQFRILAAVSASGYNIDYYYVNAHADDGTIIPVLSIYNQSAASIFDDQIIPFVADGSVQTKVRQFSKKRIVSYTIDSQVSNVGSGFNDNWKWEIFEFLGNVTKYFSFAEWISPAIDTTTAFKKWRDFITTITANNQDVLFFMAPVQNPSDSDFIQVDNPWSIEFLPTVQFVRIKLRLFLKSKELDLRSELTGNSTLFTYEADKIPTDPALTIYGNPGFLNSPFNTTLLAGATATAQTLSTVQGASCLDYSQGFAANQIFYRNIGRPLNNQGWTIEARFKIVKAPVNAFSLFICDGQFMFGIAMEDSAIKLYKITNAGIRSLIGSTGGIYGVDLQDNLFHTVRLTNAYNGVVTALNVYLDDNPNAVITFAGNPGAAAFGTQKIYFGLVPDDKVPNITLTPGPTEVLIDYISWFIPGGFVVNAGTVQPKIIDLTTTPIVHATSIAWYLSTGAIIPANQVSAIEWRGRYWCSVLENVAPLTLEAFNNLGCILDKNGSWTFKRGQNADFPFRVAAFTKFKDDLWWLASDTVDVYKLDSKATFATIPTYVTSDPIGAKFTDRDYSLWNTKNFDMGTPATKEFRRILVEYLCGDRLHIKAVIDGKQDVFDVNGILVKKNTVDFYLNQNTGAVGPAPGHLTDELNFPSDGRQFGNHIQLFIANDSARIRNPYFEIYKMRIEVNIFEGRVAPSQAAVI